MKPLHLNKSVIIRAVSFAAIIAALTACQRGMNVSDEDLVRYINECLAEDNKTPGMAVACGNYQDECKRRGKKTGNYIC